MAKKFKLEIILGNEEMLTYEHVSEKLRAVADKVERGTSQGVILDSNSNKVGRFYVVRSN